MISENKFKKVMLRIGAIRQKKRTDNKTIEYWNFYNPLSILIMLFSLLAILVAYCTFGVIEYLYTNTKDTIKLFCSEFKHFIDIKNNKL